MLLWYTANSAVWYRHSYTPASTTDQSWSLTICGFLSIKNNKRKTNTDTKTYTNTNTNIMCLLPQWYSEVHHRSKPISDHLFFFCLTTSYFCNRYKHKYKNKQKIQRIRWCHSLKLWRWKTLCKTYSPTSIHHNQSLTICWFWSPLLLSNKYKYKVSILYSQLHSWTLSPQTKTNHWPSVAFWLTLNWLEGNKLIQSVNKH